MAYVLSEGKLETYASSTLQAKAGSDGALMLGTQVSDNASARSSIGCSLPIGCRLSGEEGERARFMASPDSFVQLVEAGIPNLAQARN